MKDNKTNNEQWQLLVLLLDEIRQQKNLTHQDVADKSSLLRPNVQRFFTLRYKPTLPVFLAVAKAIGVNFFFEDKDSATDLNLAMEKAMEALGRRPDKLPKN